MLSLLQKNGIKMLGHFKNTFAQDQKNLNEPLNKNFENLVKSFENLHLKVYGMSMKRSHITILRVKYYFMILRMRMR